MAEFEAQVLDYLRDYPFEESNRYLVAYTGGDPTKLNRWLIPKPGLVRAGQDTVVRMNNDTFYQMAFLVLDQGPVVVRCDVAAEDRFMSFQLGDDRNTNFRNVIHPTGSYTLYWGPRPEQPEGEAIEFPGPHG